MTTSGTYDFNPSLAEIVLYAYMNIGIRPTSILQEHLTSARMATNMLLSRWANLGVNLWQVDLVEVPLVNGQSVYDVDPTTVLILDAYVVQGGTDRVILPISRTEYSSYPNKQQAGITTVFWFDRTLSPTVTLWPVPSTSGPATLKYYRLRQSQDANLANGETVEIPVVWMEALADGLTYRLARIWAPQLAAGLKAQADESYQIAAERNVENANTYIAPVVSGYYRT